MTIFKSSSADPHDYEPTPAEMAKFTGAKPFAVNGLDYDPWAGKAVGTLDLSRRSRTAAKSSAAGRDTSRTWGMVVCTCTRSSIWSPLSKQFEPKYASYFVFTS